MPAFKHASYTTHRIKPLRAYVDRMVDYLRLHHPDMPDATLQEFVECQVRQRIQPAQADVLYHPVPGKTVRKTVSLMRHLQEDLAQNIIVPSGTCYTLPTVRESFLKITLADKKVQRSVYKKAMLKALAQGDTVMAETNNYLQASTKIFLNSAPGAMGSPHNPLYDLPGYNAITAIARHSVKYGYAHVERLVEGNLYLRTYTDVVNYCLGLLRVIPTTWQQVLTIHLLHIPSVAELVTYFSNSLKYYCLVIPTEAITAFVSRLTPADRAFVFYAGNLRHLVRANDALFRTFFQKLFAIAPQIDPTVDPVSVFRFEHDLLAMVTSLNYDLLGKDPETDMYFELDQAVIHNPDGVRRIISVAKTMEAHLQSLEDLLVAVFRVDTDLPNVQNHDNMIRRCVIVSDTDSVIFSNQSMVEWYSGAVTFEKSSYEINAITVYVISQTLEHIFARQSCGFGMVGTDITMIAMKNEFLYPIMMRAPIKKHYAGISTIQEGKLLAVPKKDIKGLQFRSSTLSRLTNKTTEDFLNWVLTTIMRDVKISIAEIYEKVAQFELAVHTSLLSGEKTFLQTMSVKNQEDYVDADITGYFYYDLWESVFVPEFDHIQLPNKCYKIPLKHNGRILTDPTFVAGWQAAYPSCYERYQAFFAARPKKQISSLLLPPTLMSIPEFLRPAVDVRAIIHTNCTPLYLVLEALGIGLAFSKGDYLVTDFHNPTEIDIALT